jgi:hypothetical protein
MNTKTFLTISNDAAARCTINFLRKYMPSYLRIVVRGRAKNRRQINEVRRMNGERFSYDVRLRDAERISLYIRDLRTNNVLTKEEAVAALEPVYSFQTSCTTSNMR